MLIYHTLLGFITAINTLLQRTPAMISHTYSFKRFNPVEATLTVLGTSTDTATGTTLSYTRIIPLPVDSGGNVPSGSALTAYVETFLDGLVAADLTRKASLAPFGGEVSNKQDIFTLTTDVETGEVTGRPITLHFDPNFRNPITAEVTRSVLVVDTLDQSGFGLDNGNVNNATLTSIVSAGFPTISGPVTINYVFPIPANILSQYPAVYDGTFPPGFTGQYYYVSHTPIRMYNQATALFHYA